MESGKSIPETIVVPDEYLHIQEAINAAGQGDTIFVKKGTYEEQTLTINKTISLVGEGASLTIINFHPQWVFTGGFHLGNGGVEPDYGWDNAINIEADYAKISGLTINSSEGSVRVFGVGNTLSGNNITTGSETGLSIKGSYCNITDNNSTGLIGLTGSSNTIARNGFSKISVNGDTNTITDNTCWNLMLSNANHNAISRNKIGAPMTIHMGIHVAGNRTVLITFFTATT